MSTLMDHYQNSFQQQQKDSLQQKKNDEVNPLNI